MLLCKCPVIQSDMFEHIAWQPENNYKDKTLWPTRLKKDNTLWPTRLKLLSDSSNLTAFIVDYWYSSHSVIAQVSFIIYRWAFYSFFETR